MSVADRAAVLQGYRYRLSAVSDRHLWADGHWHVVDPHDGQLRELIGADGLNLDEVQARIGELYAETFATRNPAQRRML